MYFKPFQFFDLDMDNTVIIRVNFLEFSAPALVPVPVARSIPALDGCINDVKGFNGADIIDGNGFCV